MRKVRKELDFLRYEVQREKGLFNSLDRQLKRVQGKRIAYISSKAEEERIREIDEKRLREIYRFDDWDFNNADLLKSLRDSQAVDVQEMRDRVAYLRHKIDTQIPLTPWGFVWAFIKVWYRWLST